MQMTSSPHIPILVKEILEISSEITQSVDSYLDGTFGRGGHLRAVLNHFPQARALALDKDLQALSYGREMFVHELHAGRIQFLHTDFSNVKTLIEDGQTELRQFDMILLDLGISSPQVDEAYRGFSFINDGPLDMRMNQSETLTAAVIINTWPEEDLFTLFRKYGEISNPQRVIRAILQDREGKPFETTRELASLIERVEGWKTKGYNPATQYFMALRIQVNSELETLPQALADCVSLLHDGGQLFVITFHSLEDRIVKRSFSEFLELGFPVNKRVIVPSEEEQQRNPRSRSAKLRVFQRSNLGAPPKQKKDKYAHRKGQ